MNLILFKQKNFGLFKFTGLLISVICFVCHIINLTVNCLQINTVIKLKLVQNEEIEMPSTTICHKIIANKTN